MAEKRGRGRPKGSGGEWRPAFLAALRNSGNVRASCQAAGISRQDVYTLRDKNEKFAAEWETAMNEAIDVLEAAAFQRARESSDTLLIFLLKSHRREKYGETVKHDVNATVGGTITITSIKVVERVTDDGS